MYPMKDLENLIHYWIAENPAGLRGFLSHYGRNSFNRQSVVNDCLDVLATNGDDAFELFMQEVHPDAPVFERIHANQVAEAPKKHLSHDWSGHLEYRIHVKHLLAGMILCLLAYLILK